MRASAAERRGALARIGWRALIGFGAPPLVVAAAVWSLVTLSGMQRPELRGLFAHVTGASVPVVIAPVRLADEAVVEHAWFDSTTTRLVALGMSAVGEQVVERGAYRGWLRLFVGEGGTVAAVAQQTTYPGAPTPSLGYLSACSPVGTSELVGGATRWVETSDEDAPAEDTGYAPFLRVVLAPELDPSALLARHRQHITQVCGADPLLGITADALVTMIQADRQWWFDWCAQSLLGMAADCKGQDEQPR